MRVRRFFVIRIDVILDLEEANSCADAEVLDEVGKLFDARRSGRVAQAHDGASNEWKLHARNRNRVFAFDVQQTVTAQSEQIDCSQRSCSAEIRKALWRSDVA